MKNPTYDDAIRWIAEHADEIDEIGAICAFVAEIFGVPDAQVADDVIAAHKKRGEGPLIEAPVVSR
jgi:hypothetical protein